MTEESPIVFVIDDDASARRGFARLLRAAGFQVETYSNAQKYLNRDTYDGPGCILLDVKMPGLNGLELQTILGERGDTRPVVFVTGQGDVPSATKALKSGAQDFLTKPVDGDQLLSIVGKSIEMDMAAREEHAQLIVISRRLKRLSPREYEVMTHVIAGKLNKKIAIDLGISEETVKIHRGRVMHKLAVASVADLVRLADRANVAPAVPRT